VVESAGVSMPLLKNVGKSQSSQGSGRDTDEAEVAPLQASAGATGRAPTWGAGCHTSRSRAAVAAWTPWWAARAVRRS
jgi:hypothetical protein